MRSLYAVFLRARDQRAHRYLTEHGTWSMIPERAKHMERAEAERVRDEKDTLLRSQKGGALEYWDMPAIVLVRLGTEPDAVPSRDEYRQTLLHMEEHGGGFARSLAHTCFMADGSNWAKLYTAFRDLLDEQRRITWQLGEQRRKELGL